MWLTVTLWPSCSTRFHAKHKSMSSAVTVPTTPSYAMRPLLHAVLFLRFRHARVPFIGQRICPVRRGVMARLMQLPVTVVEHGSKTVATTGDRLPRMRCIGSRPSPVTVSGASHRRAGDRGLRSRRRHQPYGETRSSAIRSYRLKLCPSMLLRPHTRFMQQRLINRIAVLARVLEDLQVC
ncbi:MAG: hypothetical protein E5299_00593 [Burkholderia gladioli]|nr:MAG: hypothetical protein E5299_00593 [Burkholderia gladioli]